MTMMKAGDCEDNAEGWDSSKMMMRKVGNSSMLINIGNSSRMKMTEVGSSDHDQHWRLFKDGQDQQLIDDDDDGSWGLFMDDSDEDWGLFKGGEAWGP